MTINATPVFEDHCCHIGAPKPFVFWVTVNTVPRSFDTTLTCRLRPLNGTAFDLTVGAGITLGTINGVANALVTILPSVAQSRLIALSSYASCEIQEGSTGQDKIVMMGKFVGVGGENTGG
jgi:hypothetical protein